jgi:hypothetical protein
VNVTYKTSTGTVQQVVPTDVKLLFASTSGTTCNDTWVPSVSAIAGTGTNHYLYAAPFATSATSGSTASASGQTGTLQVCADYKNGTSYYQASSATFTDAYGSRTNVPTIPIQWTSTASGKC